MRGLVAGAMVIGLIGLGAAVVAAGKTIGETRVELAWTATKGEIFGPLVPPVARMVTFGWRPA